MKRSDLVVGCVALWCCLAAGLAAGQEARDELVLTIPGPGEVKLRMKQIPAGTFTMGPPKSERGRDDDEGPAHQTTITKPFYLGVYEVTQAQWEAVMGANGGETQGAGSAAKPPDVGAHPSKYDGDPDRPVEQVSWHDCQAFIQKLNTMGIGTFRLPTEAEWEYACRAGTDTRFYWGDDMGGQAIGEYAWYRENADRHTHPVGQKKPNPWGLYDMSGNVYEWCQDWYGEAYRASAEGADVTQTDPSGPDSGLYRVLRGGSWHHWPRFCRSANRFRYRPTVRYFIVGFRLARISP